MSPAPKSRQENANVPPDDKTDLGIDFTNTPEFQALVRAEVEKQIATGLAKFQSASPGSTEAPVIDGGDLKSIFQGLASAIAAVADQGQQNPIARLAPEEAEKRERAKQRMAAAITRVRANIKQLRDDGRKSEAREVTPRYRAIAKQFLNERLIMPFQRNEGTKQLDPVEFYWTGAPSPAMRPVNRSALEIFGHYRDWIGELDTETAPEAWVTPKGVIMAIGPNSRPPATALLRQKVVADTSFIDEEFSDVERQSDPSSFEDELGDASPYGQDDPRKRKVNVLGTVAAPATRGSTAEVQRRGH